MEVHRVSRCWHPCPYATHRAGLQLAIITVRQLPPSESLRMRVSLELRYGTCAVFLLPPAKEEEWRTASQQTVSTTNNYHALARALMQLPRANRLRSGGEKAGLDPRAPFESPFSSTD